MKKLLLLLALIPTLAFAQSTLIQGGTGWNTSTLGDLLVGTSSPLRYTKLPIGTAGKVLQSVSGQPAWTGTSTLFNTASSLLTGLLSSTDWTTFNNKAPTASPTFTGGITFATASGTGLTATNVYGNLFPTGLTNTMISVNGAGQIVATTTASTIYTGTYPVTVSGSVISTGFSTSTINSYSAKQTFTNASSTSFTADTLYSTTGIFNTGAFSTGVGIGYTSPVNKLDVSGNISIANSGYLGFMGNSTVDSTNYSLFGNTTLTLLNARSGGSIGFRMNNVDVANFKPSGGFSFGSTFYNIDAGSNNMIVEGSVGIATSSPAFTLGVAGTLGVTGKTTLGVASTTAVTATNFYGGTYSGAVVGTTGTFSSTLGVTGKTTLGVASTTAVTATDIYTTTNTVSGNETIGGTLGVTGKSTLGLASSTALTVSGLSYIATTTVTGDVTVSGNIPNRVVGYASASTITVNVDTTDEATTTVNQTTTFANPIGTPKDGFMYMLTLTATGTRTVSWGTSFASSTGTYGIAIPLTVASGTTELLFKYDKYKLKYLFLGLIGVFE